MSPHRIILDLLCGKYTWHLDGGERDRAMGHKIPIPTPSPPLHWSLLGGGAMVSAPGVGPLSPPPPAGSEGSLLPTTTPLHLLYFSPPLLPLSPLWSLTQGLEKTWCSLHSTSLSRWTEAKWGLEREGGWPGSPRRSWQSQGGPISPKSLTWAPAPTRSIESSWECQECP